MSKTQRRRRLRRRQIASRPSSMTARATAVAITGSLLTAAGLATAPSAVAADADFTLAADLTPGPGDSDIREPVASGNKLFFLRDAAGDATDARRLHVSGGTPSTTHVINGPAANASLGNLVAAGSGLFFTADDQLWKTDGTTTTQVATLDGDVYDADFTSIGGTLFFVGQDNVNGRELWKSDGTAAGTGLVANIREDITYYGTTYPRGSNPARLTAVGSTLYFTANDGTNGTELWKSDGTAAGTDLVTNIWPETGYGYGSDPRDLTAAGSTLFFTADDGTEGRELWKSDGTAGGTTRLTTALSETNGYYNGLRDLTGVGNALFFVADNGTDGRELWRSDGTSAGTGMLADINPGETTGYSGESRPQQLTAVGPTLYFTADDGTRGRELWKSDGTTPGTQLVTDVTTSSSSYYGSNPRDLTAGGSALFFTVNDDVNGRELWKSDGTTAGTGQVAETDGTNGYYDGPNSLVATSSRIFFELDEDATGNELWSAPLTAAIKPAVVASAAPQLTGTPVVGGRLTATTGTWATTGLTYTYQWYADGRRVFRATRSTFRPGSGEEGASITVRVIGSRAGFRTVASAFSVATDEVAEESIANETAPVIAGTAKVGSLLAASSGTWTQSGLSYAYQWSVDGTPVSGATTNRFVVPETAVGKTVAVAVTASGLGLAPATASSVPTAPVALGTLTSTVKPRVTGTAKVGKTLRVSSGATSPAATRVAVAWLRNGVAIARANRATYRLTVKDTGKRISARVTYTRAGYAARKATSAATSRVLP